MPWNWTDAKRFKRGLTPKQARQWAATANSVLAKCREEGGKDCEKHAIMAANGSTGSKKETEVMLEIEPTEIEKAEEELEEKGYVPFGITSFSQLKAYREAEQLQMETWQTADDFIGLVANIMSDPTIPASDKMGRVKALSDEMATMVGKEDEDAQSPAVEDEKIKEDLISTVTDRVIAFFKSLFKKDEPVGDMMIWKEADDTYRWLARYSNNFRDDDHPAEIISAKSHQRFVEMVDKGEAELPELWIWHIKEFPIGKAAWVAFDDTGFALAAGTFYPGCELEAETLSKQKNIRLSHGMPISSIKRDPLDESVIVEHVTREISVLPTWAAANKYTGFITLTKEEADMAIPKNKLDALRSEWGDQVVDHLLSLESASAADAKSASEEGRDSKEKAVPPAVAQQPQATAQPAQTQQVPAEATDEEETAQPQQQQGGGGGYATIEEVADAFAKIVKPFTDGLAVLAQTVEGMAKEVAELKEQQTQLKQSSEEQFAKAVASTPAASLGVLMARNIRATQSEANRVDGRSTLAKSAPAEAKAPVDHATGIPFIDEMLSQRESQGA